MSKIKIILKSGLEIICKCEEAIFYKNDNCEITGYQINGLKSPKQVHITPSEIAGWIELA